MRRLAATGKELHKHEKIMRNDVLKQEKLAWKSWKVWRDLVQKKRQD
jgi:hypothetical protein